MATTTPRKRAVGIWRISEVGDREEDRLHTIEEQKAKIQDVCDKQGFDLLDIYPEKNVSGDAHLEDRPGLSLAVGAILNGDAEVLVADTTDRLWWNPGTREQVLRLVGEVWTHDQGCLSNASAADELTGGVRTLVDRFRRKQDAEKSRAAVVRAIAEGRVPWGRVTAGYVRGNDGRFEVDPVLAPVVVKAFELRASVKSDGEHPSIREVQVYLRDHGIRLSFNGVHTLLSSRVLLGEVNFGSMANPRAHTPIVTPELFKAAQAVRTTRGRKAQSERLLARLGVLRCATCDARMVVGNAGGGRYPTYRCPSNSDCVKRVTISAEPVEELVELAACAALLDLQGRASVETGARQAEAALVAAQDALDAAIKGYTAAGVQTEPSAVQEMAALREVRDEARTRVDRLPRIRTTKTISAAEDWSLLTLTERRDLIKSTIRKVVVSRGRGPERVSVFLFE